MAIRDDILMHYGVKRRSGRYPWGSGKEPYQHGGDFLSRVEELKSQGKTEKEIAEEIGLTTTDLRLQIRVANHQRRAVLADRAKSLREEGKTFDEIAAIMGFKNDSSVRALLNEHTATNKNKAVATAETLKKELAEKGALDVGAGAELQLGVSDGVLREAIFILETEGYQSFGVGVGQVNDKSKRTTTEVLATPEITQKMCYDDLTLIKQLGEYHSTDGGDSWDKREYPSSIDSSRIKIVYGDEGGSAKDGVIELRRGVEDLNLGPSHYAQVRIMVNGTHYLKGMAMYSDDMPEGVDVLFNTNKTSDVPKMKVLKPIKDDPDNPFGAYIKAGGQSWYTDADGVKRLSAINKLKEEGDWDTMAKTLSSQFLSKQPVKLIERQLNLTYADYESEFDSIKNYTNPTVKRKMLLEFADQCDAAAVHMKAVPFPNQSSKVILPLTCLKDDEVYAPTYKDGEKLALVRYPHGGTFEIPIVTVNNKNKRAIDILGKNLQDAIGINVKVAERLSGADFDGDSVTVIPTGGKVKITSTDPLRQLKGFDPKTEYSSEGKTGVKFMPKSMVQKEMGQISNLITDMTLKGASRDELAKAVKHSMVVIDAEKHKLDYTRSEIENDIPELKKRWQGYVDEDGRKVGGASTLISRHKQEAEVPETKGSARINDQGDKVYKETGRTYVDKKGNVVSATKKVPLILYTDDVRKLSSGTIEENLYADYSNRMKALAREARKEYNAIPPLKRDPSAAKTYTPEVKRLMDALQEAQLNQPREREAQRIANMVVKAKVEANRLDSKRDKDTISKIKRTALNDARVKVGAGRKDASGNKTNRIKISDGEWEAIQAGALSDTALSKILRYADDKEIKQRVMPKQTTNLSTAKVNKIKAMSASYTNKEIAEAMGISVSTVSKYLNAE